MLIKALSTYEVISTRIHSIHYKTYQGKSGHIFSHDFLSNIFIMIYV